jgi:hypothetical protein
MDLGLGSPPPPGLHVVAAGIVATQFAYGTQSVYGTQFVFGKIARKLYQRLSAPVSNNIVKMLPLILEMPKNAELFGRVANMSPDLVVNVSPDLSAWP